MLSPWLLLLFSLSNMCSLYFWDVKMPIFNPLSYCSRKKNMFSRERLKLLLKQHCEPQNGVIGIKVCLHTVSLICYSQASSGMVLCGIKGCLNTGGNTYTLLCFCFEQTASITRYKLLDQNFSSFFPDEPPTFVFSPASKGRCRPSSGQTSRGHVSNQMWLDSAFLILQ